MRMSHPEDEDDGALFRSAIGQVKPLRKVETPAIARPRPKPRARMAEQDEAQALGEFARLLHSSAPLEAGDVASYRRDALPPRMFQRLKRGQYSVQDELDLHGASVAQAEHLLREFLLDAHAHDHGCVRIIHGKGLQSDGGAEWKASTSLRWRSRRSTRFLSTGAVLVLLARR
jgi:DNA-nicking Smr family endonuclease